MSKHRRKQEELNYKACSKSKYFKMALWKKRKSINSKASITHSALSHFLDYKKLVVFLTKTLIFNKMKRNYHDQVLYIINIGYVFLMILRNYMLPFWHGAYYIGTGLHMSLESTKVSGLYLHSRWYYTCGWTWLSCSYQSHCHVSSVFLANFGSSFRFIIGSSCFIFVLFWARLPHWSPWYSLCDGSASASQLLEL